MLDWAAVHTIELVTIADKLSKTLQKKEKERATKVMNVHTTYYNNSVALWKHTFLTWLKNSITTLAKNLVISKEIDINLNGIYREK